MATGRVIRFSQVNGYGFIEPDDGGEDVFVHVNDVGADAPTLQAGVRVEYSVLRNARGLRATDLRVLSPVGPAAYPSAAYPSPTRAASASAVSASPSAPMPAVADDDPIEVLPIAEYEREITDLLIDTIGTVTAAEIVEIRRRLVKAAADRGWIG